MRKILVALVAVITTGLPITTAAAQTRNCVEQCTNYCPPCSGQYCPPCQQVCREVCY